MHTIKKLEHSKINGIILLYYRPEKNDIFIISRNDSSLKIAKNKMYEISDYEIKKRNI